MHTVLLAGATGYLGRYLLRELLQNGYHVKAVVRNENKLPAAVFGHRLLQIIKAEVTHPHSLHGHFEDVDTVMSTVGITRQKDGLTYMDVDYQANMNLLKEGRKNGVKKFLYVSVFQGEELRPLKICAAKEKFADELKHSSLGYCIIRPTGFYPDIEEFLKMAKKGRVFLIGKGFYAMNPIHGADLAEFCVNAINSTETELAVGGPEKYTFREMALLAFRVLDKPPKITCIPKSLIKVILFLLRTFTSRKFYGPIEFILTVLSRDMVATPYGQQTLKAHFESQYKRGALDD